jgi:hypothetical protein
MSGFWDRKKECFDCVKKSLAGGIVSVLSAIFSGEDASAESLGKRSLSMS